MKKLQVLLAIMLMLGLLVAPISSTNVNAQEGSEDRPTAEPTDAPPDAPPAEPPAEPTDAPPAAPPDAPPAEPPDAPPAERTAEPTDAPPAEPEPTTQPTREPSDTVSPTGEARVEPAITTSDVAAAAIPSLTSGFQLQNLSTSATANVVINFYDQAGALTTASDTIAADSSKTYFPLAAVSSGFNGSVVIQSDQNLAGIVNLLGVGGAGSLSGGASYNSISAPATTVNLPLVLKGVFGINSFVNVQNTTASAANVTVSYPGTACTQTQSVPANSSKTFDQGADACLVAPFVGSATASSAAAIVAAVVEYDTDSLLAYNGFTTSATDPVMPLIIGNFVNTDTGIQIQNAGGTSTDVTLTYTPSPGNPGNSCTETKTIPAGQSANFGVGNVFAGTTGACLSGTGGTPNPALGSFVGGAAVTTNSASQPLVVIVNQATIGGANSSAYSGFNPTAGTTKVNIPLVIKDLPLPGGLLFTGFNLANTGGTHSVTCTFAGQPGASVTQNVGSAAVNIVQSGGGSLLPAGYVGSATCTGAAGSRLIAVVNEVGGAGDALLTYEGFNQ